MNNSARAALVLQTSFFAGCELIYPRDFPPTPAEAQCVIISAITKWEVIGPFRLLAYQGNRYLAFVTIDYQPLTCHPAAGQNVTLRFFSPSICGGDRVVVNGDAQRAEQAKVMTFRQCAEAYVAAHQAGWRNQKHAGQWPSTLSAYVYPHFGALPVQAIDTALVTKALEPIWLKKPETAGRVRGRIESILDWATARGYRKGENPARWRGHLENLLPKKSKVRRVEHHAALPYGELAAFMAQLRQQPGGGAAAFEFAILTAARTGEVLGARWDEINITERLWTVPAERMKAAREHRVPLSDSSLAILERMRQVGQSDYVFPGLKEKRPLSDMAMIMTLRRMGRGGLTTHGFRSTFRDWAAERTNFPREVAEMALAHAVSDKVEAAYRRGDLFEKRRQLMAAWVRYCATPPTLGHEVVVLSGGR
jgi:integrase